MISLFSEVTLLSRALLKVMYEKDVKRLICITGMGAGKSAPTWIQSRCCATFGLRSNVPES